MQHNLPQISGIYKFNFPLKNLSFFKVGGNCDILFFPQDELDLIHFLKNKPQNLPIAVLGNISNTLISDKGFRGCIIKLDKLNNIEFYNNYLRAGSGIKLADLIKQSINKNLSCCESLYCIPGTLGGAIFMNAGIPGFEIADILVSIEVLDFEGNKRIIEKDELGMSYRNGNIPKNFIITNVNLKTTPGNSEELLGKINDIRKKRIKSQPLGKATCGSTFKNPQGKKAWELIKSANCDKLSIGGAKVSDIHCNFLINSGNASAQDFLTLIELIKSRVFEKTGVMLQEEIIKFGEF